MWAQSNVMFTGAIDHRRSAIMPDALLCRCEAVSAEQISAIIAHGSDSIGSLKRQSRLGMGRCQGRYCVPEAVENLCRPHGRMPDEFTASSYQASAPCGAAIAARREPGLNPEMTANGNAAQ